jgi:alcohol dehydrogenase class IV
MGEDALQYLKEVEGKRALIITDRVIQGLGFAEKAASYLKEAGMDVRVFDEVEPEPSIETVMKGAEIAREYGPDWFVALGGGSCMDAAKAMLVLYERPDIQVEEINPLAKLNLRRKARLIAIPTTSGTGSEATWAIIITDAKERRKMELASRETVADISILDPELPLSMPPTLAADTGLDALTHAIEAYVSQWSNDFSDALAIKAIQMIFEYLPRAYRSRDDMKAKAKMHFAATMAGLAFSNSQVGVAHAMSHAVGALFNVPHGRALAVLLPYTMEYSAREAMDRYAAIAKAIGVESETDEQTVGRLVEAVIRLLREVNEPVSFREMGICWEDYHTKLGDLVNRAMESTGTVANPRVPTPEEYRKLFIWAFKGERVPFSE